MASDQSPKPAGTMSLALAVARRALLLALVALLVAIVALVAAFVVDSGSDTAEIVDSGQPRADVAAAQEAVDVATAMAEASAASTAAAQEAAAAAQEATAAAQEAAAIAQDAAALADAALARAVAAEAALVAVLAEAGTQPAEAQEETAPAETEAEAESTAEEETTSSETSAEDPDATGELTDGAEDATEDGPEQAPEDGEVSLPGEPFEFGPPEGAGLAVVGVSHDSVLNVRDVPAGEIIARLDNVMHVGSEPVVYVREADSDALIATLDLNRGVIATGNTRQLPTTIWHEIRMGDSVGWASSAFLSPLGATSDATAEILATLGETPAAPTLDALGRLVAAAVASEDPPSRVVVSGAPVVGDLGEITVDVLDLPDDAVRGLRLQIFANQDSDSDSFVLRSVESTTICDSHRGVSEEGLCN